VNLVPIYAILLSYGIAPDNFEVFNDGWGVLLENVPLTEDEKEGLIDEILEVTGECYE